MESQSKKDFPLFALLALALVTLIVMMKEVLPAGLLPEISQSLAVSEWLAGQLVTAYALGSVLTAIPLSIYTKKLNRKRLLVSLIQELIRYKDRLVRRKQNARLGTLHQYSLCTFFCASRK